MAIWCQIKSQQQNIFACFPPPGESTSYALNSTDVVNIERRRTNSKANSTRRECSLKLALVSVYLFIYFQWSPCLCYHEKVLKWQ